ncbi:hypothetical protein PFLmoz3_02439 [Pseudomonas fluorescens]|uniref:Uncharacterized protein n=1 Tax=Pseudomonas fluorescens TaxID=294 RepID=A0A109LIG0_PSEFL|nr:hypothetical protein PFLmoz3_02439 [Pseudomonas fluorescens]
MMIGTGTPSSWPLPNTKNPSFITPTALPLEKM